MASMASATKDVVVVVVVFWKHDPWVEEETVTDMGAGNVVCRGAVFSLFWRRR